MTLAEKVINGVELTEDELWCFTCADFDDDIEFVSEKCVSTIERWYNTMLTVIQINGKYFGLSWLQGKTDRIEYRLYDTELREVKKTTKMVEVVEWVAVDSEGSENQ